MTGLTQRRREPGEEPRPDDPDREPPYLDLDRLEARARELLEPSVYDYYAGGAESETSVAEAPQAWRSWRLRPRVLRGTEAELGTTLLGSPVRHPRSASPRGPTRRWRTPTASWPPAGARRRPAP